MDAYDDCFGWVGSSDTFKPPVDLLTCAYKRVKYCSKASTILLGEHIEPRTLIVAGDFNELYGRNTTSRSAPCTYYLLSYTHNCGSGLLAIQ